MKEEKWLIQCKTREEEKAVQELLFSLGWTWSSGATEVRYYSRLPLHYVVPGTFDALRGRKRFSQTNSDPRQEKYNDRLRLTAQKFLRDYGSPLKQLTFWPEEG